MPSPRNKIDSSVTHKLTENFTSLRSYESWYEKWEKRRNYS